MNILSTSDSLIALGSVNPWFLTSSLVALMISSTSLIPISSDVVVAFVESYGQVAVQGTSFSPGVDAVLRSGNAALAAHGYSSPERSLSSHCASSSSETGATPCSDTAGHEPRNRTCAKRCSALSASATSASSI